MPRAAKAKEEETPFWDYEQQLGFVYPEEGARKCTEIKRAKKAGKDYLVLTEWRFYKKKDQEEESWMPIKGLTVPAQCWEQLNELALENLAADPYLEEEEA